MFRPATNSFIPSFSMRITTLCFFAFAIMAVAYCDTVSDDMILDLDFSAEANTHFVLHGAFNGVELPVAEEFIHGADGVTNEFKAVTMKPQFNEHHTFEATYLNDTIYEVPDQITVVTDSQSATDIGSTFYSSFSSFNSHEHATGVVVANGTTHHTEIDVIKKKLDSKQYYLSYSKIDYHLMQAQSVPAIILGLRYLDDDFKAAITALPAAIATMDDQKKYNEIVKTYGTEILVGGHFGVGVHLDVFVNKTFVDEHSKSYVQGEISKTFYKDLFPINPGPFQKKSDIKIDPSFEANSTVSVFFIGGDPQFQHLDTIDEWWKTAYEYPALMSNERVSPLDTIVMGKAKAGIQKTIAYYLEHKELPTAPLK
ncbi:hypothetical protein J8273_7031 [Carpediemonas membranifera]|uniref:MACPF domain-containing protein n=1 Tax=Carpediemonas membranifera TaxID=201153 RepID=A0A8J6AQA5_9EUKA|nr:hypothetical protein J8273_7031 [Carpediemonas membranifera]|eukprot:KAG9390778.1 hypothetical protein J8273_7031 [Carpediemonas membranifera]